MPVQIEWETLGREPYNRVVEALLVRVYRDDTELGAEPLDGRGGDGGRDVDVCRRDDDTLVGIFQLKYFPGGFSGGNAKARKPQIKKSFEKALEYSPSWWTLVIPTNPTPKERTFVRSLAGQRPVKVNIMGRAQLDEAIARFPDLLDAFTRDPLVQILKETGHERAGLVRSADLDATLSDLSRRIDSRSPYWGENIRLEHGVAIRELYAKDPRASELEPIAVTVETATDKLDAGTRDRLARVLDYGGGHVVLPPVAVRSFVVEGPEWIASEGANVEVEIRELTQEGAHSHVIELRLLDDAGCTETALRGRTTSSTRGQKGASLTVGFPGGLTMTFRLPWTAGEVGGLDATYELVGQDAVQAERALYVSTEIRGGRRTEIWIEGKRLGTVIGHFETDFSPGWDQDPYLELADLAVVSKHFDVPLALPEQTAAEDRAEVRRLRLLLEGNCVLLPEIWGLTAELSGDTGPEFEDLLLGDGRWVVTEHTLTFEVQGHRLPLDHVRVFHPRARVTDGAAAVERLRAGTAAGLQVAIVPVDGTPFRGYLADMVIDPGAPLIPVPLGVPRLQEHPAIEANASTATGREPPTPGPAAGQRDLTG